MSNQSNHLISVIIPAKNASAYIYETIEAIKEQNFKNIEIVVVDDDSTDNTGEIAKNSGCKVVRINESSISKARNAGLKASTGSIIFFNDADDYIEKETLPLLYNELINNDLQAVFAMAKDFISLELTEEEIKQLTPRKEPYFGLIGGASLIKREVFDKIGLFDETLKSGEIIAWQLKLQNSDIKTKRIPIVTVNRRLHKTNFGRLNRAQEYRDYIAILRQKLQKDIK